MWESHIIIRLDNRLYLFKLCFLLQHSFRLNEPDFLHSTQIICDKTKWIEGCVVMKSGLIAGQGPWKHPDHFVSIASFTIIKRRIIFNFTEENNFTDKFMACVIWSNLWLTSFIFFLRKRLRHGTSFYSCCELISFFRDNQGTKTKYSGGFCFCITCYYHHGDWRQMPFEMSPLIGLKQLISGIDWLFTEVENSKNIITCRQWVLAVCCTRTTNWLIL